jgi:hypothetical protein
MEMKYQRTTLRSVYESVRFQLISKNLIIAPGGKMIDAHKVKPMSLEEIVEGLEQVPEWLPNELPTLYAYAKFLSNYIIETTERYNRPEEGYLFSPGGMAILVCEGIADLVGRFPAEPDEKLEVIKYLMKGSVRIIGAISGEEYAALFRYIHEDIDHRLKEDGLYDSRSA